MAETWMQTWDRTVQGRRQDPDSVDYRNLAVEGQIAAAAEDRVEVVGHSMSAEEHTVVEHYQDTLGKTEEDNFQIDLDYTHFAEVAATEVVDSQAVDSEYRTVQVVVQQMGNSVAKRQKVDNPGSSVEVVRIQLEVDQHQEVDSQVGVRNCLPQLEGRNLVDSLSDILVAEQHLVDRIDSAVQVRTSNLVVPDNLKLDLGWRTVDDRTPVAVVVAEDILEDLLCIAVDLDPQEDLLKTMTMFKDSRIH